MISLTSKEFPYVVTLKNTSVKHFNTFGLLLNGGSCILFIKEFAFTPYKNFFLLAGILLIVGVIAWNLFKLKKGAKVLFYNRAYLIGALLWIKMPYLEWLFIAFIVLALLERQATFPIEIGFSDKQIVINTLFKKKYHWSQLANAVLKDGLLTLDFHNNRILQREVEDEEGDDATEDEFNQFCIQQLKQTNTVISNQ